MTAYDLNEFEAELIEALRSGTPDEMGRQMNRASSAAMDERGMHETPEPPAPKPAEPTSTYTPRPYSKFRLWLIRRGMEWEWSHDVQSIGGLERHMAIIINYRYYGLELLVHPFTGVFRDEMNTPHAEIAAERERVGR